MISMIVSPLVVGFFFIPPEANLHVWWTIHQVNWIPILHPMIVKVCMHLINTPTKQNLYWSLFCSLPLRKIKIQLHVCSCFDFLAYIL